MASYILKIISVRTHFSIRLNFRKIEWIREIRSFGAKKENIFTEILFATQWKEGGTKKINDRHLVSYWLIILNVPCERNYRDEIEYKRSLNEPDWIKPVWNTDFFINTLKKQPVWIWVKSNTSIYNGIYIIYLQHAPSDEKRKVRF